MLAMQLDAHTQAEFTERLALLRQVRDEMLKAPADGVVPVEHAMALRALEGDIARYEAALELQRGG